jgi:rhamnosyltransferase
MSEAVTNASAEHSSRKVCGVVVTYHPPEGILDRLGQIAKHVDALVIVDNTATAATTGELERASIRLSAHLISNAKNLGIATALNQGVAFARAHEAARVAFFDQDSKPAEEFRGELENIWSNYDGVRPLGIIGSNYVLAGYIDPQYPTESSDNRNYIPADHVITSGSVYDMAMLSKLGPFEDEYFIDCVDIEYCWRALTNGYAVCRTTKLLLEHALAAATYGSILGHKFGTSNHPPFRRYFIGRNSVLVFRDYFFRLPRPSLHYIFVQFKSALLMCIFERNRCKKLGYLFRGLCHGLLRRIEQRPWEMTE